MATGSQAARLLAPAKLTIRLRITGVRSDGYHLIDAEMVTLDVCDEIIVHHSSASSVEIVPAPAPRDGTGAVPDWDVPTDRSNLVIRALELAGRTAHVEVRKRIPPGAGLGGGSADAAAVLRWANRVTAAQTAGAATTGAGPRPHPLAIVTPQQAAVLGADVPFCLVGGRARVTGVGEIVEPLGFRHQSFVLWTPSIEADTATVYRKWDELGGPSGDTNDLEPAALAAYPELAAWRDELAARTGRVPQLAGSGATWFIPEPVNANAVLPTIHGIPAVRACAITTAEIEPATNTEAQPQNPPLRGT
ncbi:MAG: 4-(cytidine 5'-diphospho)-2-C-methyl-D-erythritol kinase [Acidimicrobiaceae bacterium]|nr:4-(cytidine 5'-diphospho)-2-C-methyl-D-erythritol kinase [Acidimicrobiaceae bacterium]MDE0499194.1 4-(cytidine 5'-diphospho)-2-C-methyl-D-erythritol kinase [Acidimicrobiaceae bacterium]